MLGGKVGGCTGGLGRVGLGRILEVDGGATGGGYTQSGDMGAGDCGGQKKVLDYLQLEVQEICLSTQIHFFF